MDLLVEWPQKIIMINQSVTTLINIGVQLTTSKIDFRERDYTIMSMKITLECWSNLGGWV